MYQRSVSKSSKWASNVVGNAISITRKAASVISPLSLFPLPPIASTPPRTPNGTDSKSVNAFFPGPLAMSSSAGSAGHEKKVETAKEKKEQADKAFQASDLPTGTLVIFQSEAWRCSRCSRLDSFEVLS